MEYTRSLRYQFPLLRGEDVRSVQQALLTLHVQPPCGSADGVYGGVTASAVKAFQHTFNVAGRGTGPAISENGVVAEDTWNALFGRAADTNASAARVQAAAAVLKGPVPGSSLAVTPPLDAVQVKRARDWMAANFGTAVDAAALRIGVDSNLIYAIACQETASVWLSWIGKLPPDQVLARCVFDASGDATGSDRRAFPSNTQDFRGRFGDALTNQLIAEANATRQLRGYGPKQWVYKGYGLFQYDLQNILSDADFFTSKKWGDIQACLDRFAGVFSDKLVKAKRDLTTAVRAYNGAGPDADRYATCVMQMHEWCV
jgi:peptidoglycan hydrolase-like protein with peptidoglycan-binding domain